jgi:cellulase
MKLSIFSAALLTASVNGHGMWQKLKVNGVDQGQSNGISPPSSNNPVQVVSGASIACNTGLKKSNTVITVPAGAKVASWFQHVIGGAQYANDADNPIAASHKGPIQVYLAKVCSYHTSLFSHRRRNINLAISEVTNKPRLMMLPLPQITTPFPGSKLLKKD